MTTAIQLQSFDSLVQSINDRYALLVKLDTSVCDDVGHLLNSTTKRFSRVNINKLIDTLNQFPFIAQLDHDEQVRFINNAQLQLLSYKISLQRKRFIQSNVIISSHMTCEASDVIVWWGELVLVENRLGHMIEATSLDLDEEDLSVGLFPLGFNNEPHFILGKMA